jgi:cell division transport system permease protein
MRIVSLHRRAITASVLRVIKTPIEHLLNIFAISTIIAILSTVFLIGSNINNIEKTNVSYPQIMVSMQQTAKPSDVAYIENILNRSHAKYIKGYQFISKEDGLKDLQNDPDMKNIASDSVADMSGIVPDVLIISTSTSNTEILNRIKNKISNLPQVASIDMDENYASKISDLITFAKNTIEFTEVLFLIVLVLVLYNIIRLQMLLRQDEISISRLIGASDAFIMRPLIYYALIQVLCGSLLAFYLVNVFIEYMNSMFLNLNNLFGKGFLLHGLNTLQMVEIFLIMAVFSSFAVFIAVKMVFKNTYVK